jgi:lysyl-tRNA synthetase class 2
MLEFYQAYSNYHDLMDLTEELIKFVAIEVNGTTKTQFPLSGAMTPDGKGVIEIDLNSWQRFSMCEAIIHHWSPAFGTVPSSQDFRNEQAFTSWLHKILTTDPERPMEMYGYPGGDPSQYLRQVDETLRSSYANILKGEPYGKSIAAVFEAVVERFLVNPTIIYDYPLAVSPLSKQKPDEPDWTERFEFYIGGFEIGNAFSELNDPDDQRARFAAQLLEKARGDEEAMAEVDEDYVRALGYGLPPTAGEGIGIDRLTMILTGSRSIRDVILFPLMRPLTKSAATEDAAHTHGESAE